MQKLQAQIDYHQQLADEAKRRGDQKDMAEERLQASAATEAAYQYASELANTTFMEDGDLKTQVQAQLKQEHDQALQRIKGLEAPPSAKGTPAAKGKPVKTIRIPPSGAAPIGPSPSGFQ